MRKEIPLYNYLYQSILTQLSCGALRRGDQMPSQTELCRRYNVGITTVRRVYRMLQKEGILSQEGRTKAVILKDPPPEKSIRIVAEQKMNIFDMYRSLAPIYPVLQAQGAAGLTDMQPLRQLLQSSAEAEEHRGRLRCYSELLESLLLPLQNQVLMDWHQEISHTTYIAMYASQRLDSRYALPFDQFQRLFLQLLEAAENHQKETCQDFLRQIYYKGWTRAEKILDALTQGRGSGSGRAEYQWAALSSRTPKYTAIARSLLARIRSGEFAQQRYIPSIPQLMQEYTAAQVTICSAVSLLNDIGAIQTAAKKGSTVVVKPLLSLPPMKLDRVIVAENIIYFLDAMQILTLCWKPLAKAVYPMLPEAECRRLAGQLDSLPASASILLGELLQQLSGAVQYEGQRQLLAQLADLLLWGHYLKRIPNLQLPESVMPAAVAQEQGQLVQALADADWPRFYDLAQTLFHKSYAITRWLVLQTGVSPSVLPSELELESEAGEKKTDCCFA